jgi:hypothetical protein
MSLGNGCNRFVTCNNVVTGKRCSLSDQCDRYVMQQQNCSERCFLCGPCRCIIRRTSLEFSELWDSSRPVRTWTRKLRKLQRWKPLSGDNRWRFVKLRVTTICTCSINLISIPNPVYSHSKIVGICYHSGWTVKLSLCLIKHHAMKTWWTGDWSYSSTIHDVSIQLRALVGLTHISTG